MRNWTFSFIDVALGAVDLPDAYTEIWEFAYAYPPDCLKLERVYVKGGLDCGHVLRLVTDQLNQQSRVILSQSSPALASYVLDVTNTDLFTPLFTQAFVLKLAAAIVVPLTNSLPAKGAFLELYRAALADAEEFDSKDSKPVSPKRLDTFNASRIGSGITNECFGDETASGSAGSNPHLNAPFR